MDSQDNHLQDPHGETLYKNMVRTIEGIREDTRVPSPSGSARSLTNSPLGQHPTFQPSPRAYQSLFAPPAHQAHCSPNIQNNMRLPTAAEIQHLILRKFIHELPSDSPSPFKTEIFTATDRRWIDSDGAWQVPPVYRPHCVVNATTKITLDPEGFRTMEGRCAVWTKKFPSNPASVTYDAHGTPQNVIWAYLAAATCVDDNDVETSIECPMRSSIIDNGGIKYDLEPGWNDVVGALKWKLQQLQGAKFPPRLSPVQQQPQRSMTPNYPAHWQQSGSVSQPIQNMMTRNSQSRSPPQVRTATPTVLSPPKQHTTPPPVNTAAKASTPPLPQRLTTSPVNAPTGTVVLPPTPMEPQPKPTPKRKRAVPKKKDTAMVDVPEPVRESVSGVVQADEQPPKLKQKRAPRRKKETPAIDAIQQPSGMSTPAAALETTPSTTNGGAGTKRKSIAGPASERPAKKRAPSTSTKASPASNVPSEVRDTASETIARAQMQGTQPSVGQFGPPLNHHGQIVLNPPMASYPSQISMYSQPAMAEFMQQHAWVLLNQNRIREQLSMMAPGSAEYLQQMSTYQRLSTMRAFVEGMLIQNVPQHLNIGQPSPQMYRVQPNNGHIPRQTLSPMMQPSPMYSMHQNTGQFRQTPSPSIRRPSSPMNSIHPNNGQLRHTPSPLMYQHYSHQQN